MSKEAHDVLFRALASDPMSATSLVRRYTPPDLVRLLSDAPPRLLESTLVRPQGEGKLQADAVFEVNLRNGEEVLVYILFENLSGPGQGTPLKLLHYMAGVWARTTKRPGRRKLKPIVPVAICHGPGSGSIPETFLSPVDVPDALAGKLQHLDFGITVHDLKQIPRMDLADDPATRGALLAMKVSHVKNPPLETLEAIVRDLADREEDSLVWGEGLNYVLCTLIVSEEQEKALLATGDAEVRNMMETTIAERHEKKAHAEGRLEGRAEGRVEGRVEGHAEGRAEGRAEMLLDQLSVRFGKIPQKVAKRVRAAGPAELKAWSRALLYAGDLNDVFGSDEEN